MKWEPAALILLLIALGLWLVYGPVERLHGLHVRPGAQKIEILLGSERGVVDILPDPATGERTYRVLLRGGYESEVLDERAFRERFGSIALEALARQQPNPLFRLLNITTWASLAWVTIGLLGQLAFSGRMLVQWIVSERSRASVVPAAFWWMSLIGGLLLFAYFVWRKDAVGVLGQSSGIVIYARNLKLIRKQKRRMTAAAAQG